MKRSSRKGKKQEPNKFYVGHPRMTQEFLTPLSANDKANEARWAKPTLRKAIEHGREILEKDPSQSAVLIVQVVRVVRRRRAPVTIEKV